jgi:DNA polymerase
VQGDRVQHGALRNAYLEALGIDRWVPRHAPAETPPPVEEAVPVAAVPRASLPAAVAPPPRVAPQVAPLEPGIDWGPLRERVAGCVACDLCKTRTQTVFGVGNTRSDWLIVGEAPGGEEDRRGEPFVGRAGQLLDAMLLAIGLPRESVFIANILKCRPPGNRDPRPEEVMRCLPFLHAQIELLEPRLILVVGRIAAQTLLATDAPLARLRGKLHQFGAARTPLVITYHPAYLLRTPADKRKAWEDLKFARATYGRLAGAGSA